METYAQLGLIEVVLHTLIYVAKDGLKTKSECLNIFIQEFCKKLHQQIDKVDEERYDLDSKVGKANKEVTSDTQTYLIMIVTVFLMSLYTGFSELLFDFCLTCV